MIVSRISIFSLLLLAIMGCSHERSQIEPHTALGTSAANLYVYRLKTGMKSAEFPVAELMMPRQEYLKFLATMEFRDREFRKNTFENACYVFHFVETESERAPAAGKDPVLCYNPLYDKFSSTQVSTK